jgi:hypothetical protein
MHLASVLQMQAGAAQAAIQEGRYVQLALDSRADS